MLFVSRYFNSIPYDDDTSIIWHSIFGRPMLVSNSLAEALNKVDPSSSIGIYDVFGQEMYLKRKDSDLSRSLDDLTEAHILHYSDDFEKIDIEKLFYEHNPQHINNPHGHSKVKSLSLIMSEECQFRCKYCIHFANSKHYYNPQKFMLKEVAKTSIDQYFETIVRNRVKEAYINFGGGEPLINWELIKELLPYIRKLSKDLDIPVKMGINTNLGLLTPDIAQVLIDYDVEIAASLDGSKESNDLVRLTKDLKGTYDQIMRGFKIMRDLGRPLDGFAMTVTEDNFFGVNESLIDWAASLGMKEVRIDIDVVGMVNVPVDDIVTRLISIRRYAKSKGISVIGFWSRPAENMGLVPENEDVGFCGGERGNSLCVAPSGQVFPCGYSNYEIGKYDEITDIYKSPAYLDLIKRRNLLRNVECQDCPILGFCRGGCMITREAGGGKEKISRMCELYTKMTYEILRESVED